MHLKEWGISTLREGWGTESRQGPKTGAVWVWFRMALCLVMIGVSSLRGQVTTYPTNPMFNPPSHYSSNSRERLCVVYYRVLLYLVAIGWLARRPVGQGMAGSLGFNNPHTSEAQGHLPDGVQTGWSIKVPLHMYP